MCKAWASYAGVLAVTFLWICGHVTVDAVGSPEIAYDALQLTISKGYPFEDHRVMTDDHYILSLHRIPYGRNANKTQQRARKPAILLQHGVLASSEDWILNEADDSLAFILADNGYDVWMANSRGNKYSRRNSRYAPTSTEFWRFSFEDMAKHDLPAFADYVSKITGNEQIYYVGHSQGTLVGFIQFSEQPEWAAKRIRQFHALAPIAYMGNVQTALKYIAPMTTALNTFLGLVGMDEFVPNNIFTEWLAARVCGSKRFHIYCTKLVFMLAGYDDLHINVTRLPIYIAHTPAGTSTMNMVHLGQLINSGRPQRYSYGYLLNTLAYGSLQPPEFHPERSKVPTALYWGALDQLSAPLDVAQLESVINSTLIASYKIEGTDHLDFVWGTNAATDVYPKILEQIRQSEELQSSTNDK